MKVSLNKYQRSVLFNYIDMNMTVAEVLNTAFRLLEQQLLQKEIYEQHSGKEMPALQGCANQ